MIKASKSTVTNPPGTVRQNGLAQLQRAPRAHCFSAGEVPWLRRGGGRKSEVKSPLLCEFLQQGFSHSLSLCLMSFSLCIYFSLSICIFVLFLGNEWKVEKGEGRGNSRKWVWSGLQSEKLMEKDQRRRVRTYISYISLSPLLYNKNWRRFCLRNIILLPPHHLLTPWWLGEVSSNTKEWKGAKWNGEGRASGPAASLSEGSSCRETGEYLKHESFIWMKSERDGEGSNPGQISKSGWFEPLKMGEPSLALPFSGEVHLEQVPWNQRVGTGRWVWGRVVVDVLEKVDIFCSFFVVTSYWGNPWAHFLKRLNESCLT